MLGLILLLVITGTAARVVIYQIAPHPDHPIASLMKRLDLGHEPSLPNWYSSLALLTSSLLLAAIAFYKRVQPDPFFRHWSLLALLFLLLAMDEAILIHEMANAPFQQYLQTEGIFYFGWIVPAFFFVLLTGWYFLRFVLMLESGTRRRFVLAGTIFLFGALGMEMIEGVIVTAGGLNSLQLTLAQAVEEFCEMTGIAIFIYALLRHLQQNITPVLTLCLAEDENPLQRPPRTEITAAPGRFTGTGLPRATGRDNHHPKSFIEKRGS